VVVTGDVSYIRIHDEADSREDGEAQRSVKNDGSVRNVPIHPQLAAEGFLAYVAALPYEAALFPDIPPDKLFGNRGNTATKRVSRWLREKLGITDGQISPNHSWRHWFIERAREARIDSEVRNAITGHADNGNESHGYGRGWRMMPEVVAADIAKVRLPA
jgi:integrase